MNALPVKNQIKNVFRGNQIFTKFYLIMGDPTVCRQSIPAFGTFLPFHTYFIFPVNLPIGSL